MINQAYALQTLEKRFGTHEFTARDAADALSFLFTNKTAFVALSNLSKSGSLFRVKKGLYVVIKQEAYGLKSLRRPEITFPNNAYATGTYALSVNLTPYSSPGYLDIFVRGADYPRLRASIETEAYPQPRVYPFATQKMPRLERSPDGFPVPLAPEVAFVDLIKIAAEKCRPVSLEYEIVPYMLQLTNRWPTIRNLASREKVQDHLEAITSYIAKVASDQHNTEISLPSSRGDIGYDRSTPPKLLSFEGGKVDETSLEVERKTGVLIEANKEAIATTIGNL